MRSKGVHMKRFWYLLGTPTTLLRRQAPPTLTQLPIRHLNRHFTMDTSPFSSIVKELKHEKEFDKISLSGNNTSLQPLGEELKEKGVEFKEEREELKETEVELTEKIEGQLPICYDSNLKEREEKGKREEKGSIGTSSSAIGYTSELFKIEIKNVPPYAGFKQVRKRLNSLNVNPVKVKLIPTEKGCCFVTFRNEEERQLALTAINGHVWKKNTLRAQYSKPNLDPLLKKRKASEAGLLSGSDEREVKKRCIITADMTDDEINEKLKDSVTPLCRMLYYQQLEKKYAEMKSCLKDTAEYVKKIKPDKWFYEQVEANDGMLCPLLPILPSPVLDGYRNKCEFTAGYSHKNETVLGFRIGSFEEGITAIAPPTLCVTVPQYSKDLVEVFTQYVRRSSYKPKDPYTFIGNWDQLTVKRFNTHESMAILQFDKQELSEEELREEKEKVIKFFKEEEGSQCCPTSLYWLTIEKEKGTPTKRTYEHLLGEKYIHENILGLKYRVSPEAFFQVNTLATEILYSTITDYCMTTAGDKEGKEECSIPPSTIFDVCCGTGTIGITLAKRLPLSKVYGVELSQQAIEDAHYNAQINGVANIQFIAGRAEDVLPSLMMDIPSKRGGAIAVVDPPRAGLHPKVVQAIRRTQSIDKLIYVSCDPDRIMTNIADLCREHSNRIKGAPFRPVSAVPVDLFPHTNHCEMIIVFERIQKTPTTQ